MLVCQRESILQNSSQGVLIKSMKQAWPKYFNDLLIKGDPKSPIGIVSLWLDKRNIANMLGNKNIEVSLIGQLYSKDGINWILRNIFLNPFIRKLIICGEDKSGSGEALVLLSKNGIDNNRTVIGSSVYLHDEIEKEYIEAFRKNVEVIDLRGENPTEKILEEISNASKSDSPWIEPKEFPEAILHSPETMPSEQCGFKIEGEKMGDIWLKILDTIMRFGNVKKSQHSSDQREVVNLISVITGEKVDAIDWKPYFLFTKEELQNYLPQVLTKNPIPNVEYTYGQRLRDHDGIDQITSIIEDLKKTPYSRRAVAVTWKVAKDHNNPHAPCLDLIQCLVQNNKLFFTAYIRSNDMFRAWPMNALALLYLQKTIAEEGNFKIGPLTIISSSAHIYSDCWNEAKNILEKYGNTTACRFDPRGNFVINVEGGKIKAKQLSPSGQQIFEFSGKTAREVFDDICINQGVSLIEHAFDLGAELQKAEIVLKQGMTYAQDQFLKFDK